MFAGVQPADVTALLLHPSAPSNIAAFSLGPEHLLGLLDRLAQLSRPRPAGKDTRPEAYTKAIRAVASLCAQLAAHLQADNLSAIADLPVDQQRLLLLCLVEFPPTDHQRGRRHHEAHFARWILRCYGKVGANDTPPPFPDPPFPCSLVLPGNPEELGQFATQTLEEYLKDTPEGPPDAGDIHWTLAEHYFLADRFAEALPHLTAAHRLVRPTFQPDPKRLDALLLACRLALRVPGDDPSSSFEGTPVPASELANFLDCERARINERTERVVRCVMADTLARLTGGYTRGDHIAGLFTDEYRWALQHSPSLQSAQLDTLDLWCDAAHGGAPDERATIRLLNGNSLVGYLQMSRYALATLAPAVPFHDRVPIGLLKRRLFHYLSAPRSRSADPIVFAATVLTYCPDLCPPAAFREFDDHRSKAVGDPMWRYRVSRLPKTIQQTLLSPPCPCPESPPPSPSLAPGPPPTPHSPRGASLRPHTDRFPPPIGLSLPIAHAPPAPPTAFRPSPQRTLQDARRCVALGHYQTALELLLQLQIGSYSVEAEHWLLLCKAKMALESGDSDEWDTIAAHLASQRQLPSLACTIEILTALSGAKQSLRAYCNAVTAAGTAGDPASQALVRFVGRLLHFQRLSKAPPREFDPRAMATTFGELLEAFATPDKRLVPLFCRALTWYRLANVIFQACGAIIKNCYHHGWETYKEGLIGPPFDVLDRLLADIDYRVDAPGTVRRVWLLFHFCCHRLYTKHQTPLYSWLLADTWMRLGDYDKAYAHYLLGIDTMYPTDDRHIVGNLIRCCELTDRWAHAAILSQFRMPPNLPAAGRLLLAGARSMDPRMLEFLCEGELLELLWVRSAKTGDTQKQAVVMAMVQSLSHLKALRPHLKGRFISYLRQRLT